MPERLTTGPAQTVERWSASGFPEQKRYRRTFDTLAAPEGDISVNRDEVQSPESRTWPRRDGP